MPARSRSSLLLVIASAALATACVASSTAKKHHDPLDPGDGFDLGDPPPEEQPMDTVVDQEAGQAFDAPSRPQTRDASFANDAAAPPPDDGGVVPDKTYCEGPLAAGDLAIVELMISSRAGSADDGEWLEVRSTRDCWLRLDGVTVESPRGTAFDVAAAPAGLELAPRGSFVVADSVDPAKNHAVPGIVLSFDAADVLKNTGDTVSVKLGGIVVDTLTFPAFSNLEPGRSLAFPSDCAAADRADWQRWSLTFGEWTAGLRGTPNAANDDVACY